MRGDRALVIVMKFTTATDIYMAVAADGCV